MGSEDAEDLGRRFLVATAITRYANAPQWNRPDLEAARNDIVELFTGSLGYQHISDLGLDPTKDQLTRMLRAFCRMRQPEDLVAVYITGHGEVLDGSQEHVILASDTDPDDIADALPTVELARKMLLDTPVRRVLLILDTCYSGHGANDLAATALTRMTRHWDGDQGTGLVIINSAQPAEQAQTGAFPALLRAAVDSLSTAGYSPSTLALDTVIKAMNDDPAKPGFQTISSTLAHLTGEIPPFLLNPRHARPLTDVDLAIQQATEWESQTKSRDVEFRRLLVKAMGGYESTDRGWWFAGREAALVDIVSWLNHPDAARPVLAVTAAPGSGKTAVLGMIAALTHRERRATVPIDTLGLPRAAIPAVDAFDVVIYAQNLTTDQVMEGIAAAAGIRTDRVGELLEQLTDRPTPLTVLVDALDEAADPNELVRRLLRPMVDYADGRLRLLVGTRPHLLAQLGVLQRDSVDLDASRYSDLAALTDYSSRGLLDSVPGSPYRAQQPETVRAVARAVAEAAAPSFLVARITSRTLAADSDIPDPGDPGWRETLPTLPGDAMGHDLTTRLGDAAAIRARDLLRPVAFAEGQGLPWEDIWADLASRIAGTTFTDDDVIWLQHYAGSYVIEVNDAKRSAYRLYHQAFAEYLRDGVDMFKVHSAFTSLLRSRVPVTTDGTRVWTRAHPYALRHLATHAARCGQLDGLLADVDYVVNAEPAELLMSLRSVSTRDAQLMSSIYRASAATHRHLPPARRRQLLATDAARFAASLLHRELSEQLAWPPRWATGQQSSAALNTALTGHTASVHAAACASLAGVPVVVTGSVDGMVKVWDLATGTLRTTLPRAQMPVRVVECAVLRGRPIALIATQNPTVDVWDLADATSRMTLSGHEDWVNAVACMTVNGKPVAVTASNDGTARVWDLTTGACTGVFRGHRESVRSVACATIDGVPVAVTASDDKTVRVWDLSTSAPRDVLTGHEDWVNAVTCAVVDGQPVAITASHDKTVRVWDLTTGTLRHILAGHDASVRAVASAVVSGLPVALSAGEDATVRVWDLTSATLRAVLTGHDDYVRAVACTTVDRQPIAVTASEDKTVRVWDLAVAIGDDQVSAGHTADIRSVSCGVVAGKPVVVTAGQDATARVWDLTTGEHRVTLSGHDGPVNAVTCAVVDGCPVAVTASQDGTARVWDLATGVCQATVRLSAPLFALACTVIGGQLMAVISRAHATIELWDLSASSTRALQAAHSKIMNAVACATIDSQPVAVTASDDATVRVWNLTSGTCRDSHGAR
jgi:WD40 repeat protein